MNRTLALIAAKATLGASLALGLLLTPHATAHADDINAYEDDGIIHVNLSELPGIDYMPICMEADGSDIDPALLPCIWNSTDENSYLTFATVSYLIVDDTTVR